MRYFTLRMFEPLNPDEIRDLRVIRETHYAASTAEEGKRLLTNLIGEKTLERERFYRFEGSGPLPEVRPDFFFNISFYLFSDGRLCPVRIRQYDEQFGTHSGRLEWAVDFNGIPAWSLIASLEPRWYPVQSAYSQAFWVGRTRRDWYKRDCWALTGDWLEKQRAMAARSSPAPIPV